MTADFTCSESGEVALRAELERTLAELRATPGCLQATVWTAPGRRLRFFTLWRDADAVAAWVSNPFHRETLMPGFKRWCTEGCFGEWRLARDHDRARRCAACGRWTAQQPGWDEDRPGTCRACGAGLPSASA